MSNHKFQIELLCYTKSEQRDFKTFLKDYDSSIVKEIAFFKPIKETIIFDHAEWPNLKKIHDRIKTNESWGNLASLQFHNFDIIELECSGKVNFDFIYSIVSLNRSTKVICHLYLKDSVSILAACISRINTLYLYNDSESEVNVLFERFIPTCHIVRINDSISIWNEQEINKDLYESSSSESEDEELYISPVEAEEEEIIFRPRINTPNEAEEAEIVFVPRIHSTIDIVEEEIEPSEDYREITVNNCLRLHADLILVEYNDLEEKTKFWNQRLIDSDYSDESDFSDDENFF